MHSRSMITFSAFQRGPIINRERVQINVINLFVNKIQFLVARQQFIDSLRVNNTVQYTLGNFSLLSVFIFFILFFSFFAHFKQRIPPFAPFAFRFKIGGFPQVIEPDTVSLHSSPVLDDPCIVKHVSRERLYIYVLYKYKCVRNTRIRVIGDIEEFPRSVSTVISRKIRLDSMIFSFGGEGEGEESLTFCQMITDFEKPLLTSESTLKG